VEAIVRIHGGERFLSGMAASRVASRVTKPEITDREADVLRHLADGLRNKEIADKIGRSEDTVKMHLKNLFEKLGATNRTDAIRVARERGLLR
jgi:DNA-binding NarL/FixJ family response regulator